MLATDPDLRAALAEPLAVLFKHSTRCGISSRALSELERFAERHPDIPVYILDVVADRRLAGRVASETPVPHQSPQVIVVESGAASWDASHFRVSCKRVEEALERLGVLAGDRHRPSAQGGD
jgi:bacillithiol system protein YtxJ